MMIYHESNQFRAGCDHFAEGSKRSNPLFLIFREIALMNVSLVIKQACRSDDFAQENYVQRQLLPS